MTDQAEWPPRCGAPTKAGTPCRIRKDWCKLHPQERAGERLAKVLEGLDEWTQYELLAAISGLIEPARKAIKRGELNKALEVLDPLVFHLSGEG